MGTGKKEEFLHPEGISEYLGKLVKIRAKEPLDRQTTDEILYPGFVAYMCDSKHRDTLSDCINGKLKEWPDVSELEVVEDE